MSCQLKNVRKLLCLEDYLFCVVVLNHVLKAAKVEILQVQREHRSKFFQDTPKGFAFPQEKELEDKAYLYKFEKRKEPQNTHLDLR